MNDITITITHNAIKGKTKLDFSKGITGPELFGLLEVARLIAINQFQAGLGKSETTTEDKGDGKTI